MSNFDEGFAFHYYLKSKYPDDYLKFIDDKTPDEVKASIVNRHTSEFDIWKQVPYDVLLHWNGNPPEEIMYAASQGNLRKLQLDPFRIKEQDDVFNKDNDTQVSQEALKATAVYTIAVEAGYSIPAAMELAREGLVRENLRDKALKNLLSDEERDIWLKSREKTRDIIRKDWAENNPERLLVHIFAKYNRGQISAEELTDTTRELMGRIDASGRHEALLNYLSDERVQRRLSRFDGEVLDALSQTILSNIRLTEEQSQAIQSHIASRSISRAKREMLEHTPDNLTSKQRIQNIPSTLVKGERTI